MERTMKTVKKRNSGFTLVELVTVIVIMSVLIAVVYAKFLDINPINLSSEADVLKSHLRYAQSRAMNTNAVWGINISGSNQYSLFRDGSTANSVLLPGQDSLTLTLPAGISFSATGIISFDTWGKPYTNAAGTASQVGSRVITLTLGSLSQSITITQNTGLIP